MPKHFTADFPDSFLKYEPIASDRFSFSRQFVPRALPSIPFYRDEDVEAVMKARGWAISYDAVLVSEILDQIRKFHFIGEGADDLPPELQQASSDSADVQRLLNSLKSEVGYLFYDRTRIRPAGFRIGEHLYSLSLAPGEEVTIEQKTWTKRDVSLEQMMETEATFELELQSTFATEIQESLDEVKKIEAGASGTLGGNADVFGLVTSGVMLATSAAGGVPVGGSTGSGPIGVNASIQPDIRLSDELTQKESVKKTYQQTSKLSAKYRSLHRTTFKVTTERGTESTSLRTIRNPNRTTPINLLYFKILREHEITHERYGVRLCWSPWVKDPGQNVRELAMPENGQTNHGIDGTDNVPPKPEPPSTPEVPIREPTLSDWSDNYWIGEFFDGAGSMSINSGFGFGARGKQIKVPDGWEWDGDQQRVELHLNFPGKRNAEIKKVGDAAPQTYAPGPRVDPEMVGTWVGQQFHVGIDCTKSTPAGRIENLKDNTRCTIDEKIFRDETSIKMRVGLRPILTPQELAWKDYHDKLDAWNKLVTQQAGSTTRPVSGVAHNSPPTLNYNPLSEMMRSLARQFGSENTNDSWEIEYWHRLFDWENAGYTLYPSWWSGAPVPYPYLPVTHFLNASWAKLFIPVRPGCEYPALRWIIGRQIDVPLNRAWETEIERIKQELEDYRADNFGHPQEFLTPNYSDCAVNSAFKIMACWSEVLPTDGTHLEVIQSASTAADDVTTSEIEQSAELRKLTIDGRRESIKIRQKAVETMQGQGSVEINIDAGSDS